MGRSVDHRSPFITRRSRELARHLREPDLVGPRTG